MRVNNTKVVVIPVLVGDPLFDGAKIVAKMKQSGRLHPREYARLAPCSDCRGDCIEFLLIRRIYFGYAGTHVITPLSLLRVLPRRL